MEGWQLHSALGGQQFDFVGTGHVLDGGRQLTIYSGKDGQKQQAHCMVADSINDHIFW